MEVGIEGSPILGDPVLLLATAGTAHMRFVDMQTGTSLILIKLRKIIYLFKKASDTNSSIFLIFILIGMSIISEVLNI